MGGRIRIDSAPGRGTTFEVLLPLPPVAIAAPADEGPRRPLPPKRVLLVEDDPTVAETVAGLLARDGHVVRVAAHGLEALAALDEHDFDLALLDLDLPVVDGFELARLIRAGGHALPLAALTARVDPRDEPAAFAAPQRGAARRLRRRCLRLSGRATTRRALRPPAPPPGPDPCPGSGRGPG
jgi:CheY-like chemotaxis protein